MDRLFGIKKDEMTNCYMKNGIYPLLTMLAEEYPLAQRPFTVLVADLDHFKSHNDTYGHLLGDDIIKYFSSSIRLDLYGVENFPFRFGGDEFVVVFPGLKPEEVIPLVARMREHMKTRKCLIKGSPVNLTFSGGVASFPADGENIEDILDCADKALYEAKRRGRNRVVIFSRIQSDDKQKKIQIAGVAAAAVLILWLAFSSQDIGRGISSLLHSDRTTRTVSSLKGTFGKMARSATAAAHRIKARAAQMDSLQPNQLEILPDEQATHAIGANPVVGPVAGAAEPHFSTVFLKSGGKLIGTLLSENASEIKIKLAVSGEAILTINRINIEKIENE